jgi:hypothetical protein
MVMSGAQVTLDVGARNGYVAIGLTIAGVAADTRTCLLAPRLRDAELARGCEHRDIGRNVAYRT